jgi:hypothetical protein
MQLPSFGVGVPGVINNALRERGMQVTRNSLLDKHNLIAALLEKHLVLQGPGLMLCHTFHKRFEHLNEL